MGSRGEKVRKVVHIDEEKCNGCGLCVPACAEGAIQIIDGKARLIDERYCDGLGACIGECPQGAITIEEREAEPFEANDQERSSPGVTCPSCGETELPADGKGDTGREEPGTELRNELRHWPVQLALVNPKAPFFRNAELLVVADCVPFVCPDFHQRFLRNRSVVVGCPKLDDADEYVRRLAELLAENEIRRIVIAHMEVPCCFGLKYIVEQARKDTEKDVPVLEVTLTIKGEIVEGGSRVSR